MRRSTLVLLLLLATSAVAIDRTPALLAKAWPAASYADVDQIGSGVGVVFSPDLSVPGNCNFYKALGFACFQSADWLQIVADVHAFNLDHPGRRVRTLILETHGTNGHGLKVQTGKAPDDERSYVSVGALQEILEPVGVRHIILSACNSGRLLRPEIYLRLNREPGDKLFLPATRGIIDATDEFLPHRNQITVITPGASHIETTLVGSMREFAPGTRSAIQKAAQKAGVSLPKQFAISELMIRILIRDPKLALRTGAHVEELSREETSPQASERIFTAFVAHLNYVSARDGKTPPSATRSLR